VRLFSKEWLDVELTEEEFRKELEHLWAWISKRKRSRLSWLMAVRDWATGDR